VAKRNSAHDARADNGHKIGRNELSVGRFDMWRWSPVYYSFGVRWMQVAMP